MSLHAWNLCLVRKMKRDIGTGVFYDSDINNGGEETKFTIILVYICGLVITQYELINCVHNKIESKTEIVS
jgi:hypothetical protein